MDDVAVMIVHHEEEARRSTRAVVGAASGFEVVGEAATAEEALELAVALRPDLAIVAVRMPGIDGFETSRRLKEPLPDSTVVLLYASGEPDADVLTRSAATAALHVDELTPASLQAFGKSFKSG
jgi:DNA-binding NarL/FixJ family response regulator